MEDEKSFLSTKEVARFLDVNEKMIYSLISDKGLPATKVTGKWLFPRHLVERWLEGRTVNYPGRGEGASEQILVICGSNDLLLDETVSLFNTLFPEYVAVFGNVGSMGGIRALNRGWCQMASSHLLQEDEQEYNFDYAARDQKGEAPAVVNFCRREQGLLVAPGNPKRIASLADAGRDGIRIANRPEGTGTRLLLDCELGKAGIEPGRVKGYGEEFRSHLEVGFEVAARRADTGLAIRPVAELLGLDFISLRWERYDLLVAKDRFFDRSVQRFLALLHERRFREGVRRLPGYDLSLCGSMVFPPVRRGEGDSE